MNQRRGVLRESFRELVVVVASILLAFSLQAWWDSRSDRQEETLLLTSLLDEFNAAGDDLNLAILQHSRIGTAAFAIWNILAAADSGHVLVSDTLVPALIVNSTYNPTLGTLAEAQSSGRVGFIRNDELRGRLATLPGLLEDAREEPAFAMRLHETTFHDLLGDAVLFADLNEAGVGGPWMRGDFPASIRNTERLLPSSLAVQNYLGDRARAYRRSATELTEIQATVATIVGLIERELDR